MSIALKYWAFQQTGWGQVTAPTPPAVSPPSTGDEGQWIPVYSRPRIPVVVREPLVITDRGFPQNLKLFTYGSSETEIISRIHARLSLYDYLRIAITQTQTAIATVWLEAYCRKIAIGSPSSHETFYFHTYEDFAKFQALAEEVLPRPEITFTDLLEIYSKNLSRNHIYANIQQTLGIQEIYTEAFRVGTYGNSFIEEEDLMSILPAIIAQILEEIEE